MKVQRNSESKRHRWTNDEIKSLMVLWGEEADVDEIATVLGTTRYALNKMVNRLRKEGVPLKHRTRGHKADRFYKPWSQGEVEYLLRRRGENATDEEIGTELGRSYCGVQAMVKNLRDEGVEIPMRGRGMRRKWCPEQLKATAIGQVVIKSEIPEEAND